MDLMIQISNTENLAGVSICGDWYDLEQLVDALHEITVSDFDGVDKQTRPYVNISIRVLGLAYDIRHAAQGDREYLLKENGIDDSHQEYHHIILPRQNVYFSCNVLYPEMILLMMALNELVQLRIAKLVKSKYRYDAVYDKKVIWDQTISVVRMLQSAFQKAISDVLSPSSYSRWLNLVTDRYIDIARITDPFIDTHNIRYIGMSREERAKKLLTITRRFVEYKHDPENNHFREAIDEAVKERGWEESNLRFQGLEYPKVIEW